MVVGRGPGLAPCGIANRTARLVTRAVLGDEGAMDTQRGMGAAIDPSRYGMRALVTRPRAEAASLAEALAARGIAALLEPLLDIRYRDLGDPLDLAGVQAVLCTSANGVRAFARLSEERDRAAVRGRRGDRGAGAGGRFWRSA